MDSLSETETLDQTVGNWALDGTDTDRSLPQDNKCVRGFTRDDRTRRTAMNSEKGRG